jgi:cytosine deaminase
VSGAGASEPSAGAPPGPPRCQRRLLPPLRLPRALLDPCQTDLGCGDADGLLTVRLELDGGRLARIHPCGASGAAGLDAATDADSAASGSELPAPPPLAITPLVEPHAHLDKAYTWAAYPNRGGGMDGALAANLEEGAHRSVGQVLERGERALDRAWRYGLRALRSHVDSGGPAGAPSWRALLELRERWRGRVELQLVALVPLAFWSTAEGLALAERVAAAGGLLGGVLGPPYPPSGGEAEDLRALLRLADRLGCGVDLHVDEGAGQPGVGVALLTRLLEREGWRLPITCSHSSSLGLLAEGPRWRLAERMAAVGLAVVAVPTTNAWLLGRRHGLTTPERPLAPVRLLQQAGVAVALGADNVQDPWYPGGDFDPVELLRLSLRAVQLPPWLRQGLMPFTTVPSRLLDLAWDGVLRPGSPADLLVLGAGSWSELLARPPQRRVLRAGQWLPPPPDQDPDPRMVPFA